MMAEFLIISDSSNYHALQDHSAYIPSHLDLDFVVLIPDPFVLSHNPMPGMLVLY